MNKKNLAILISKHPLLRKLTEDKTIPKSIVARLIVEELLKENPEMMDSIKARIDKEVKDHDRDYNGIQKATQLIKDLPDSYTPELRNKLEAYLKQKIAAKDPGTAPAAGKEDKDGEAPEVTKAKDTELEEPFNAQEIYEKGFDNEEKEILKKFKAFIAKEDPMLEAINIADKLGLKKDTIQNFMRTLDNEKEVPVFQKIFQKIQQNETLLKGINWFFEQAQTEPSGEPQTTPETEAPEKSETEPETGGETSGETKDPPPSEIPEEQKNKYIDASTKFQNEFYNQKYRIQQAKLIGNVIDAIEKIYDNPNQVAAFARPPQEPKPVAEQQETVEPSKDELRNLRVDFRSFLSRVNKTSKALEKFEKIKKSGSMITDTYKKQFIDLLKEVQMSIKRIHRDLQIIIGKRQINEIDENSDTMKKWKEVETKYNKAVASASALRELIDGTSTPEEPEQIIQDTYASLSDLATHFPSINPFASSGAKTREDMNKYKNSFENAVKQVKSDLQNVLSLINQGQSGEDTLQLAMEGLKTFSGAIQNTFGIQSQFKDVKVEKDTPATQGKAQPEKKQEPSSDIEEPIQVEKNGFKLKLPPPPESVAKAVNIKSKQKEFNRIRDIIRDAASQNTGTAEIDLSNNIQRRVSDLVQEIGLEEPQKKELNAYFDEQEKNMILFDKIMASSVPGKFGLSEELQNILKLFKFYQEMKKESNITEQVYIDKMLDQDPALRKEINEFLEEYSAYQKEWSEIQNITNAYDYQVTKQFLQYLKNPIRFPETTTDPKQAKKKKETAEDFYPGGFVPDSVKEQIIANKLKPLIREMLNKGK